MKYSASKLMKETAKKFKCPICHLGLASPVSVYDAIKLISRGERAIVTCPECGTAALIQFDGLYTSEGLRQDVARKEEYYYLYATIFGLTVKEEPQIEFPKIDSQLFTMPDVYTAKWEILSFKTPRVSSFEEDSWDVFICHAHEDKDSVARPLAEALREQRFRVWYDEFSLKLGDGLRRSIDQALVHCRYAVVILSRNFFDREWPQRELDGLAAREIESRRKVILPVWHGVDRSYVEQYSPTLADKFSVSTSQGWPAVVKAIKDVISDAKLAHEGERLRTSPTTVLEKATEIFECPICHQRLKRSLGILDQVTLVLDSQQALVSCPECGSAALFRFLGLYRSTGEKVEIKRTEEYYYVCAIAFGMTSEEGSQRVIPEIYIIDFPSLPTDVYSARWFVERFTVPRSAHG